MFQISAAHRIVGVPVRPDLHNLFPDARQVTFKGNPTLLLPHDLGTTKLLRNSGIDVPAPILSQYDWCGGNPFEVQKKTAALLTMNMRAYCLNGMGTGKTKSTLWSFDFLRAQGYAKRALVVAPLSTLVPTWTREVFETTPHLSVGVLHGTKQKRLRVLAEDHDIYVINPDGLGTISADIAERDDIDVLVIDELSQFRSGSSSRNKVARRLAEKRTWVWGLTGTPTPNEPTDAWGQCAIITPHTVPRHFGRFRDATMRKVTAFKWAPKDDAAEHVFKVMQPAVRFSLSDVTELPDIVERVLEVPMGPRQKEIYDRLRQHAHALVEAGEITAANAGAVFSKLLQISLGYVYSKEVTEAGILDKVTTLDNEARLEALVDAVEASDRKVLVFAPFTHAIDGIRERLEREGIEVAVINGKTKKGERDAIFAAFQQTTKYKAIVAHPGTMSHGLTLVAASTIIWFGPTTSLETFEQANARIRRVGQKNKQLILMLQGTAAEKRMYARLQAKAKVQDGLLDMFAEASDG